MIWRLDYTGRFPRRPHWEVDELERRCEEVMVPFLEGRYGQVPIRLPTDALTVLIEREAEELDLHADLIADNNDEEIHGVTWFFPGAKPKVQINRSLRREFRRAIELPHDARARVRPSPATRLALRSLLARA